MEGLLFAPHVAPRTTAAPAMARAPTASTQDDEGTEFPIAFGRGAWALIATHAELCELLADVHDVQAPTR